MNISKQFGKQLKIDKQIWKHFGTTPEKLNESLFEWAKLSDWTNVHWDYNIELEKFCFGDTYKKKPQGYYPCVKIIMKKQYTMIVFYHDASEMMIAGIFDNDKLVEWPGKFE